MNPKGLQHSAQSSVVRNGGGDEQVACTAGAQVMLKVGSGGLKCHLDSSGENLRWPWALSQTLHPHSIFTGEPSWAGAPIQPPGLSCCSNTFCEGAALRGGHTLAPRSWENATAARPAAPPANKAPAGKESEQPIVVPGRPPGAPGLHPGDLAPPPQTPNTCSLGHLQGCPPHTHTPGEEDEDAPFGRSLTPFPRRDQ